MVSSTRTHTIAVTGVSDELMERLDETIRRRGVTRADYLRSLLESDLMGEPAGPRLEDLLAPFRQGFAQSDMTEEELVRLIDSELQAVRADRRERRSRSHGQAHRGA